MLRKRNNRDFRFAITCFALAYLSVATEAHAQAMPWENPLRQLLASLQGPTAQAIIIGAIVIAGLALCVGEAGSFFTLGAALLFGLHSFIGVPVCIFLHILAVKLAKQDPCFLDTFRRHINHKPFYRV